MSGLGYGWTTIVKVINNTDKSIKHIKFIYNSEEISVNVKNIKPNTNKQVGISTLYTVRDLKMIIDGVSEVYLIKSIIPQSYRNTLEIVINSISSNSCELEIIEVE